MATRSTIAIQREDGTVAQIYCRWDGYLDNNGKILLNHYQDPAKIEALIAEGSVSSLGSEIGEKHGFDERFDRDDPRSNWTRFYGRDRGEDNVEARVFGDLKDYLQNAQFEEYDYLFRKGAWYVQIHGRPLIDLHDAIMEEEALDD